MERPGRSFFHMRGDPVTGASGFVPIERVRDLDGILSEEVEEKSCTNVQEKT